MDRPNLEVANIFRQFGPAWRQANAGHISLEQLKVMSAIERCRYIVTRGTFSLNSQCWDKGDVYEQRSTRDTTQTSN